MGPQRVRHDSDFHFPSPALQGDSLPSEPPGKTKITKLISEAESE